MPLTRQRPAPAIGADAPPLVVVDAGARGGVPSLARGAIVYAFDPDPSACAGLADRDVRDLHVVCAALAAADGVATLHVTRDPALSSLLEPDLEVYEELFGHMADFPRWRHALEVVERREVDTLSLDTWAERTGLDDVHFLKIDTQGTELDVLRGGLRLLSRGAVQIVQAEVALRPFYRGQADFTGVDALLTGAGFELVDCRFAPGRLGPTRRDGQGVWGETPRWTVSADATYLSGATAAPPANAGHRARARALVLGQLGYGSTAASVLAGEAGLDGDEIEAFLRWWARPTVRERRRAWLRHRLPAALVDAWRRL